MKFTYQDTEYELAGPATWTTLEAITLERLTGAKTGVLWDEFVAMNPLGVHCAVWISLVRAGVDVAWDKLELPYSETIGAFGGDPGEGPPDPSTASTEKPKDARRSPSARARSGKK